MQGGSVGATPLITPVQAPTQNNVNPPYLTLNYRPIPLDASSQGTPAVDRVGQQMIPQPALPGGFMYGNGLPQPQQGPEKDSPVPGEDQDKRMQMYKPKDWSDGLCDCSNDITSALLSCCLQPLRFALTIERAKLTTFCSALFWMTLFWLIAVVCEVLAIYGPVNINHYFQYAAWLGIGGAIIYGTRYRIQMRTKYEIQGNDCEDCLYHTFLSCCALSQEARHVDRSLGLIV